MEIVVIVCGQAAAIPCPTAAETKARNCSGQFKSDRRSTNGPKQAYNADKLSFKRLIFANRNRAAALFLM